LKVAKNKAVAVSRNNDLTTTTNETTSVQSSQVWQYAIRCPNSNFSTCCLCPNNKKISTNNGSTSTLRKHLIAKHQLYELAVPNNKRKRIASSIDNNKRQQLHDLFSKCIIRDGRTFNDFQKSGLKKILQELIPG
jgi:thioredoxin-related protein